jgi:hypothetical protein
MNIVIKNFNKSTKPSLTGPICESVGPDREAALACKQKKKNESMTVCIGRNTELNDVHNKKFTMLTTVKPKENVIRPVMKSTEIGSVLNKEYIVLLTKSIYGREIKRITRVIEKGLTLSIGNITRKIKIKELHGKKITMLLTRKYIKLSVRDAKPVKLGFLIHSPLNNGRLLNEFTNIVVRTVVVSRSSLLKTMLYLFRRAEGRLPKILSLRVKLAILAKAIDRLKPSLQLDCLSKGVLCYHL